MFWCFGDPFGYMIPSLVKYVRYNIYFGRRKSQCIVCSVIIY